MINIDEHLGLVHMVVKRFKRVKCIDQEDLFQYGCVGLVKAAKAYNSDFCQFSTYAVPKIQGEISRALRDHNSSVHYARDVKYLYSKIKKNDMIGCTPEEVANHFGVSTKVASAALNFQEYTVSLESETFNDQNHRNFTYAEITADEQSEFEDKAVERVIVDEFMETLDERQRKILRLYTQKGKSQLEISKVIGVSQVQISRNLKEIYRLAEEYGSVAV